MKLNLFERLLVNNSIRSRMLRESVRWLRAGGEAGRFPAALEIGCGCGAGLSEITRHFAIGRLDAFDLDIRQVSLAAAGAGKPEGASVWVGDGAAIATRAGTYDAVFEFTIFHHIPAWPAALAEVRRVLKPGGLFLFEELSREFFNDTPVLGPILRWGTAHPWESMFDFEQFRKGLLDAGLRPRAIRGSVIPGWHLGIAEAV